MKAGTDDRRKEVAASPPADGGGELSVLSTTAGQLAVILAVVALVGAAVGVWTLRPSRR